MADKPKPDTAAAEAAAAEEKKAAKPHFPAEGSDAPKSFILAERLENKKGVPDLQAGSECAIVAVAKPGEEQAPGVTESFVRAHPWLVASKTRLRELAGKLDVGEGVDLPD